MIIVGLKDSYYTLKSAIYVIDYLIVRINFSCNLEQKSVKLLLYI